MKYFMSVYSPFRERRRVFLMSGALAVYYYNNYLSKFSHVWIQRCLESGARTACPHGDIHNGIHIWGENISNAEVFQRILKGELDKEKLT